MTVIAWTGDDLDVMLSTWEAAEGIDASKVNFNNFQVGGGEASAKYDQYFLGGEDVDLLMVEADWALKYINDDTVTAPLDALGFTDADWDKLQSDLKAYGLDRYLEIHQKYLDAYFAG